MRTIGVFEARNAFSELLADVEAGGEEVVITRHGKPVAKLGPAPSEMRTKADEEALIARQVEAGRRLLELRNQIAARFPGPGPSWEEMKRWAEDDEA